MKEKKNAFALGLIEELKKKRKIQTSVPLKLQDLLCKDNNSKTLLEYMLEYNVYYHYELIPGINSSYDAVKIFTKYNKLNSIGNISNNVYLTEENNKYFIEKLIEIKEIDMIHNLTFDFDVKLIDIFLKKDRKDLLSKININASQLSNKISNEKDSVIIILN